jgi:hypothetical protein
MLPNKDIKNHPWMGAAVLAAVVAACGHPAIGLTISPGLHAQIGRRIRQGPVGPPTPSVPQEQPGSTAVAPTASTVKPQPSQPEVEPAPPQAVPPSLLNQPAAPAEIRFTTTSLFIHAQNSSLNDILHAISSQSGMKIQGLGGDERVFGNFGPGQPRDVLSQLLNGTPYNVLMVGDLSNGAPRQLVLTPAAQAPAMEADNSAQQASANDKSDSDDESTDENAPGQEIPKMRNPQGIRSPQQIYQELQRMREQQKQQQQQQQGQQQQGQQQQQEQQ